MCKVFFVLFFFPPFFFLFNPTAAALLPSAGYILTLTFIYCCYLSDAFIQNKLQKYFIKMCLSILWTHLTRDSDPLWYSHTKQLDKSNTRFILFFFLFFYISMLSSSKEVLLPVLKNVICHIMRHFILITFFLAHNVQLLLLRLFRLFQGILNVRWCPIKIHFGSVFSLTDLEPLINLFSFSVPSFSLSHFSNKRWVRLSSCPVTKTTLTMWTPCKSCQALQQYCIYSLFTVSHMKWHKGILQ